MTFLPQKKGMNAPASIPPIMKEVTVKRVAELEASKSVTKKRLVDAVAVKTCVLWDILQSPNVTEITSVQSAPLRIELLARPAGQGKNTPVACFATEQTLIDLDTREKVGKSDYQKRRRILEKLSNALIFYNKTNVLPASVQATLQRTEWGLTIMGKLKFAN